ncbi:DAPG hydrolase family protein [Nocardia sp. NPDC004068]|uniref:DAPG hydrolase family protein n=1 Tax=Nocardia sp. NPDC004068 TaxID=3364303 RepID=UPI0036C5CFEC
MNRRRALALGASAASAFVAATGLAHADEPDDDLRYPGYSPRDRTRPYARYLAEHTAPPQPAVADAYRAAPTPAASIPPFADLVTDLAPGGYSAVETGYGATETGVVWVAVRTEMPRVSAAMWDWWFGWHLVESARYKLWHPDAHLYAEVAADRVGAPLPDRAKYIGNISYVDEYIGPKLQQLAIAFRDPVAHGFTVPDEHTVILGRVGSAIAPVDLGWLAHQVRPVADGCEMRSRFYLRLYGTHPLDPLHAARAVQRGPAADPADLLPGLDLARDLMLHCGQEMNHLAGFLPELYEEFGS